MLSSTETEKKLTLDLKTEVSGDFSKALLLLAEVTIMHMTVLCVYICSCFPFGVMSSFFFVFQGKRDESTTVDAEKAKEDAKVQQSFLEEMS